MQLDGLKLSDHCLLRTITLVSRSGESEHAVELDHVIIAGWAGRDREAVEAHIRELEHLGVKRPRQTPLFYRVAAALLTTGDSIEVVGTNSSGEVEAVVFNAAGDLWVGVGSDHTDRALEAVGVTLAKQVCAKPIAPRAWRLAEVREHWDELVLRSYAIRGGHRALYQHGTLAGLIPPWQLVELYGERGGRFDEGAVMFCGTLPVAEGIYYAEQLELELHDPILNRTIGHSYKVEALSIND